MMKADVFIIIVKRILFHSNVMNAKNTTHAISVTILWRHMFFLPIPWRFLRIDQSYVGVVRGQRLSKNTKNRWLVLTAVHHLIQVVNNTIPTILNKMNRSKFLTWIFQFVSENRVKSRKIRNLKWKNFL